MRVFTKDHYVDRREDCLKAAAETGLPNAKKRHLEAAEAWQQIIDRLGDKLEPLSDVAPSGSELRSEGNLVRDGRRSSYVSIKNHSAELEIGETQVYSLVPQGVLPRQLKLSP